MNRRFAALSHEGLIRKINEDSYCLRGGRENGNSIAAVADGLGGNGLGEIASEECCRALLRDFAETDAACSDDPQEVAEILRNSLQKTNEELFRHNCILGRVRPMGCTVVAAVFLPTCWVVLHAGDSRLYEWTAEGAFLRHTRDDTLGNSLRDSNHDAAALHCPYNPEHIIMKAVGTLSHVEPAISVHEKLPDSTFLLCTDGLTHEVQDDRILEILERSVSLRETARALVRAALVAGGEDNITIVLTTEKE